MPTRSRDHRTDLLVRPPSSVAPEPIADPVDQVAELADLHTRGFISRGELAAQVAKVIDAAR